MKIGVLGTGMVGIAIASKLIQRGHQVMMGARTGNNEKAVDWVNAAGAHASQGAFAEAARFGEIVFNCTAGMHSLEAHSRRARTTWAARY